MPILGLDISKWDGNWNTAKAKQAGIVFAFIKASQATFTDPRFVENWQKAKEAGLFRGAYHYLDYTQPAVEQANYFANLLETDPGELPMVVDYEEKRLDNNYGLARSYLRDFLDQLRVRKVKPMIYMSRGFWNAYGEASTYWLQYPLWLANWTVTDAPPLPAPWTKWIFWQFTSDGPGDTFGTESARVDMNKFFGSMEELNQFSAAYRPMISSDIPLPTPEERIATLEDVLSNLEPVFTEAFTSLEGRVKALEDRHASGDFTSVNSSFEECYATVQQQMSELKGQNTAFGQQLEAVNLQMTAIKQQVSSLPDTNLSSLTDLDKRISAVEQKLDSNNPPPATQPSTPPTNETYAICNVRGLNVRRGPGMNHAVITGLVYGQRVKILGRQSGWAQLESPVGWCAEQYLSPV